KHQYLDNVGITDDFHATQRNEDGKNGYTVHADREIDIGNRRYGERAQEKDGSEVDHDVQQQPENSHDGTHRTVVPLVEELRHGVNLILEVYRYEIRGYNNQCSSGKPLGGRDGQSQLESVAAHADDLLGRNIGGYQRCTDGPPGERTLCQKIILRIKLCRLLAVINPKAI